MSTKNYLVTEFPWEELKETFSEVVKKEFEIFSKQNPKSDEDLITRSETAKILGISLATLHDFTQRGIVPAYRLGTRIRYKKSEVLDSLKAIKSIKYKRG